MAGLHHLLAGFVNRRFFVMHRANKGVAMGLPSHAREVFADAYAGNIGGDGPEGTADGIGRVRFQIPGIELAGTAGQEEKDTIDVPLGSISAEIGQR